MQELQDALRLDQPLVSQQLAVLRGKNIVVARKLGHDGQVRSSGSAGGGPTQNRTGHFREPFERYANDAAGTAQGETRLVLFSKIIRTGLVTEPLVRLG